MIDSVEKAIYPFSITAFLFGFGSFRCSLHSSTPYFSIFYGLFFWSVYIYAFYSAMNNHFWFQIFSDVLISFTIIMNLFVTMISLIITTRKHKNFRMCIRKLNIVEDTLEELGTPNEYHKLRGSVKRMLIVWFMIICVTTTTDSLWTLEIIKDSRAIVFSFIMDYTFYINTCVDIMFILLLRYIGSKFDKINGHIERLPEIGECGLRRTWKEPVIVTRHYDGNTENCRRIVWIAMHLHLELCQIARNINDLFGIQMTLQMISYFILIIAMCYMQLNMIMCLMRICASTSVALVKLLLSTNVWLIVYIARLILLNHICESVSDKAQKTRIVMHKLTNHIRFAEMREDIFQVLLQISLRPLQFDGMGMFSFGYTFIHKFFLWIVTAIIFLLQRNTSTCIMFPSSINSTICN